jgi:hypothetical protein
MGTKFKSVPFRQLPAMAHYSYCRMVSEKLSGASAELLAMLGTLPDEFNQLLETEEILAGRTKKSFVTTKIAQSRQRMNRALVAIRMQVHAAQHRSEENVTEAARRLYNMLQNYGYVYRKTISSSMGATSAIVRHLTGDRAEDAALVGLEAQTVELREAGRELRQMLNRRNKESVGKPRESLKSVMHSIEKVYHRITTLVDAGATAGISPDFPAFIDSLNPRIEALRKTFHRVRYSLRYAQPEGIPPQTYTGQPITPTPVVSFTLHGERLLLQLGKDYNITYRDNTKRGVAQCIFHGKGMFTGRRMVTFSILEAEDG